MNSLSKLTSGMVGICILCTAACRSSRWESPNDIAALQAERRAKVEKSVGLKRTDAELQLARDAWTFGDGTACLSALDGILEREPGHVEALLLKAEVHLAKDQFIDADRSIAIALSHDPSNSTAKRLSEIARTKQLAARREAPARPANAWTPLPGGAVSQTTYSSSSAGTAVVADIRPETTEAAPAQITPLGDMNAQATEAPLASAAADVPAATDDRPEFVQASAPLQAPPDVASFDEPGDLAAAIPMETRVEKEESHPAQPLARPDKSAPVLLTPEEGAAYELSGVPAGDAEVTDQLPPQESSPPANAFASAIASGDPVAALAAVETDMTNNPNDPQIPISATVAALEADRPETAASIARLGIAFHPSSAGLYRTLGAALYRSGNYSSSQVALQQALSLDNSSALAYFLMGRVSEKLGDTEAAQSHFARANELDPNLAVDGK